MSSSKACSPGKNPETSAHFEAYSPVLIILTSAQARSGFSALWKTERFDPPRNDGDSPPSGPGIGTAPSLPLSSGELLTSAAIVQLPAIIIATSPRPNASDTSASSQVAAAGLERSSSTARSV